MFTYPTDPCSLVLCEPGYECQVYEETGETFCSPNCEDFNPCGPEEICVITTVYCIRSPCPGVLSCEEGNNLNIFLALYNPTLLVMAKKACMYVCIYLRCKVLMVTGRSTTLGSIQSVMTY